MSIFISQMLVKIMGILKFWGVYKRGGAYEVWNYRTTVDFIAICHCTVDFFYEIMGFRLSNVVELPNTVQYLPKSLFHWPKNCQTPNTVIEYLKPPTNDHL